MGNAVILLLHLSVNKIIPTTATNVKTQQQSLLINEMQH